MSALILDGRIARESLIPALIERVKKLSYIPTLAIIQVGTRPDSTAFISAKKAFAKKIGVAEKHVQLPETISQGELIAEIEKHNADDSVQGIILQLPLPSHIDRAAAIGAIDYRKDVDGLTPIQVKNWSEGREGAILPATARGIRNLLAFYKIDLAGKKVVVIGRSDLVGKPIAAMCRALGAEVTVCHRQTPDLTKETLRADVIMVAAGKTGLIRKRDVRNDQIVIDVGINTGLVGDVDFEEVKNNVTAITPVPGGVGPMTVHALFENVLDLCVSYYNKLK